MESNLKKSSVSCSFASRMNFELHRAERYRIFVSLVVLNVGPVMEMVEGNGQSAEEARTDFLHALRDVLKRSVREIDAVSNSNRVKIGLLFPETSRQGAEAAVRRILDTISGFCADYFKQKGDFMIPIEISSFPDAAGARSLASYLDEFKEQE